MEVGGNNTEDFAEERGFALDIASGADESLNMPGLVNRVDSFPNIQDIAAEGLRL